MPLDTVATCPYPVLSPVREPSQRVADPRPHTSPPPTDTLDMVDDTLARMAAAEPDGAYARQLRNQVICQCLPAARREALRFRRSGEPLDDLIQVATVGLIHAVDRFDPGRGIAFRHFALPTIKGELKRHFRDKGWMVRVSRRVQELYQDIRRVEPELAQQLGREPSDDDLAQRLNVAVDEIRAARTGGAAYTALSLNAPVNVGGTESIELGDLLGERDHELELIPDRDALKHALSTLPDRLRTILCLRFVDDLTQTQIADKLGISQMQVSRLLTRALDQLRRHILATRPTRTGTQDRAA
jgi:RNA polymerase sigma-B factor